MGCIIGRENEIAKLQELYNSGKSEFVAVYGRRRIGKTFLIDEALKGKITIRHAGLSPVDEEGKRNGLKEQLKHFYFSMQLQGMKKSKCPTSWMEAFYMLAKHLETINDGDRQILFIDELPWLDTPRSGFITAFEGFWNTWGCHNEKLMLVVCGSANSWMLDNLVNNHGGLYGRTTCEIRLRPFRLSECEKFFDSKGVAISRYDIAQNYMIMGGIPYYMSYFQKGLSLAQNVDKLFFADGAKLCNEYDRLFASIFSNPLQMKAIVEFLSARRSGYTREEIIQGTGLDDCGYTTKLLNALIASDFVSKYVPFGKSKRVEYYKLIDSFCLFYLKWVKNRKSLDQNFWTHNVTSQKINVWRGFAFEELCFTHIDAIKKALSILGVASECSSYVISGDDVEEGTQIDLLIIRNDNVVDMCEMKFYNECFSVTKAYNQKMIHRQNILSGLLKKRQSIHSVLVTTEGMEHNAYSGTFQSVVTLDDLFNW